MKFIGIITFLLLLSNHGTFAQKNTRYSAIHSGVPWYDQHGNVVSAHGANIILEQGRYFLFGEAHSDTSNQFAGFNCYSSTDFYNWKFERIALPLQKEGKLGPGRVGERVKVMKCPSTSEFIMYMHVDTLGYKDQFVGYATSKTITGPYVFRGPLLFNGNPIRKWDMGTFQDQDGSGYLLIHGGEIYKLKQDFKSVGELINPGMTSGFESPAMFRKDSIYYFLGSHLTSWEKNENYYYTATSLKGPWTHQGIFTPKGTLTWNSQTTFVLPVVGLRDTTFLFMGDRWSYPKQASAASYVWQPLSVSGHKISIPNYLDAWQIDLASGTVSATGIDGRVLKASDRSITYKGDWSEKDGGLVSGSKGASFSASFRAKQIAWYGQAGPKGGYARLDLRDGGGRIVLTSTIDMYCAYTDSSIRFLSPVLSKGDYTLTVSVLSERPNWSDKRKSNYGSTGYEVSVNKIVLLD